MLPNAISGPPSGSFHTGEQKPNQINGSSGATQSVISVKSGGICAWAGVLKPSVTAIAVAATPSAPLEKSLLTIKYSPRLDRDRPRRSSRPVETRGDAAWRFLIPAWGPCHAVEQFPYRRSSAAKSEVLGASFRFFIDVVQAARKKSL